jgi:hypothetical protein
MKFHVTQMSVRRNRGERVYVTGQRNAPPARPPFSGHSPRRAAQDVSRTVSDEVV